MSKRTTPDGEEAPQNFLEQLQASILRRLSRTPWSREEQVVYEFTNDRALLHQYYRIREIMYRKVFHTDKFIGAEDVHDKISHILIARRGKLVIGGCRLTIRETDEDFALPMETPDFKLRNVFPNLPLRKLRHGEISRFAILDEDEDKFEVMHLLSKLIIEKCVNSELGFVFFKSNLPMARNWRKIIRNYCGLEKVRICTEVQVPENPIHPDITWYLCEVTLPTSEALTPHQITSEIPEGQLVH